jgi:hypothetical protein
MEFQDWTPVVLKRRPTKKEAAQASSSGTSEVKDSHRNERSRLAKMDMMDYSEAPKKRIESESIQLLIRKRMEMKLNQEKADQLCNFQKYTFKNIEANCILPNSLQQSLIQKHFGVQLKIITI